MSAVLSAQQKKAVQENLPLVEHIVGRISAGLPAVYSRDDLVQTGIMGLISATVRYDPEVGATFSTYAGRRIEGAVLDMLRRADWAPRSVRARQREVAEAEARLGPSPASTRATAGDAKQLGARLAAELGMTVDELEAIRRDIDQARLESLDQPVRAAPGGEAEAMTVGATIPTPSATVEGQIDEQELVGYLRAGVAVLPERHRLVIVGFYFEGRSMTELGELLGVTQSRASQIKDDAIKMLRAGMNQAYGDPASENTSPLNARHAEFSQKMVSSQPWRDRLEAGRGISVRP